MSKSKLFMETTEVSAEKTAGEIISLLVQAGATAIINEYANGKITALTFAMKVGDGELPFRLPVRTEKIFKMINGRRNYPWDYTVKDREQAERVAWRQLLRWTQAQLAMIQTGMAKAEEVFMPYWRVTQDQTFFEKFEASGRFKALPAPNGEHISEAVIE